MKRLKWEGLPGFSKMKWTALYDPSGTGATGAFYKTYRNFAFYWILKAGHMVGFRPPVSCSGICGFCSTLPKPEHCKHPRCYTHTHLTGARRRAVPASSAPDAFLKHCAQNRKKSLEFMI